MTDASEAFTAFVQDAEPKLRQALTALCGPDQARDAAADGLTYAWANWSRVRSMENPVGYVYRVARSRARPRKLRVVLPAPDPGMPEVEPGLADALASLPERQRVAVLLIHGWEWRPGEVAELMDVSVSTVRNHLARGLDKLRTELGVTIDG